MRSPSPDPGVERREGGFTVVEIIITVALLSIVMIPILNTIVRANETARFSFDRNEAIDDLRLMMNDVAKDIRQATEVTAVSTSALTVSTYVDGTASTVTWEVPTGTTQLERTVDGGTARIYVVDLYGYSNDVPIFAVNADRTSVTVDLATRPDARHPEVRLTTEVELRNAG